MSYKTKTQLSDEIGQLLAQYYNPATDEYELIKEPSSDAELKLVKEELQAIKTELANTKTEVTAVKTEVSAVKTNQTNGTNKVQVNGSKVTQAIFQNAAIATGWGTQLTVADHKTLTVEIYGTSTSRKIEFMGAGFSDTYRPITGVKLADLVTGSSTTGTGELWQFDITGLKSVAMNLTAVAGGNVTVVGMAVV